MCKFDFKKNKIGKIGEHFNYHKIGKGKSEI
jgi:hypothetical protein